jgi:hypothetical protein
LNNEVKPEKIFAVDNPTLTQSFINQWKITIRRKIDSNDVFFSKTYTKDNSKMCVMENYQKLCNKFDWNAKLEIPLILTSWYGLLFYFLLYTIASYNQVFQKL